MCPAPRATETYQRRSQSGSTTPVQLYSEMRAHYSRSVSAAFRSALKSCVGGACGPAPVALVFLERVSYGATPA